MATTNDNAKRFNAQNILMKYESRRYNKDETSKEFYLRRKQEMNKILESDTYKKWHKKIWVEYKKKNGNLA